MKYLLLFFASLFVAILIVPIVFYGPTQPILLAEVVFGLWLFLIVGTVYEKVNKWLQKRIE